MSEKQAQILKAIADLQSAMKASLAAVAEESRCDSDLQKAQSTLQAARHELNQRERFLRDLIRGVPIEICGTQDANTYSSVFPDEESAKRGREFI